MKKRILSLLLLLATLISLASVTCITASAATSTNKFTDVSIRDWFYSDVCTVARRGLMNGVGNNKFSPYTNLTHAEAAQLIYNFAERPSLIKSNGNLMTNPFTDVKSGDWYYDAVCWCNWLRVFTTSSGKFNPNTNITREKFMTWLYRAYYFGNYGQLDKSGNLSTASVGAYNSEVNQAYTVAKQTLSATYKDISSFKTKQGIYALFNFQTTVVRGNDKKEIKPQDAIIRCEVAAMINRFWTYCGNSDT